MRPRTPTPSPYERRQSATADAGRLLWDVAMICALLGLASVACGSLTECVSGGLEDTTEEGE